MAAKDTKAPMKVVTIAAPKGGSGKTTTTCMLAVRAMQDGFNVAMIDLNADQANLTQWWVSRGSPFNPYLVDDIENITPDVRVLRASGRFDYLFIDCPPSDLDLIENAVAVADCVVVPVRTSIFDVSSINSVIEMCRSHHKPFRFLLSAADTRFKELNASALATLVSDGEVFATRISYRLAYINSLTAGKTGPELARELQPEVNALWSEVKSLAASQWKPPATAPAKGRAVK